MNYSKSEIKNNLDNNNFQIKKKFGQNFITDKNTIIKIVEKANILEKSLVIEIGPGIGSLTNLLCKYADNVICYEIDKEVEPILKKNIGDNVKVLFKDFLTSDIKDDIKDYNYDHLYVVANLPYYITTPIIMHLIKQQVNLDKIVVMVQKEVGDRFKATPNSKEYNSLSVYLNYYFNVKKLMDVSKNIFLPVPNVDSIVVELSRKDNKIQVNDENIFFKLVKDSFQFKRKNLKNNLKGYDLDKINKVLNKYNLDLSARAEQLSIEMFANIANNL